MVKSLIDATVALIEWPAPLFMLAGIALGLLFGILPGVGGTTAVALLLPISFGMDPSHALIMLMSALSVAGYGGMLTAILFNIPATAPNAATTLDGYPMARRGESSKAIGAATASSLLGTIIGMAFLVAVLPVSRNIVLAFSYPEFFIIAVFGIVAIAVTLGGQTRKGLIAGGVGLMLSFIGRDPITGSTRFEFGQIYLWDGLDLAPVLVGIFAGAEMVSLYVAGSTIFTGTGAGDQSYRALLTGMRATLRHWRIIISSSVIGIWFGLVPGIGGTAAAFMARSFVARKGTGEDGIKFGEGAVEGVIASECANDADNGGSLLPTVALGIPGGTGMAIFMAALLMHGVAVGPALVREEVDIVYLLIMASVASRLVASVLVALIGHKASALTRVRPNLMVPVIIIVAVVGTYAIRNSILDVWLMILFAFVGYGMASYGYSRVPLIIGLVLGGIVETSYHQTIGSYGSIWAGLSRPISLFFVAMCLLMLAWGPIAALVRRSRTKPDADRVSSDVTT